MNKEEKQAQVAEIGERLEASTAIFAVDYRGISVPQAAELRTKLREADASFSIVKNRLAKRITADAGVEVLDEHLVGPTALTYVRGDAVMAAKAISDFIKEHQILAYKGGIMDGEPLDVEQFRAISRLPGVEVLRGQLVGMAAAPLTGVVRGLNGLLSGLASQLGQIAEQGLVSGEAAAEGAPAEEASAEAEAEEAPEEEAQAEAEEEAPAEAEDEAPAEAEAEDEAPAEAEAEESSAEEASAEADSGESEAEAAEEAESSEPEAEESAEEGAEDESEDETDSETKED